jgi:hypothetical protein|tara:strand:+ start:465 stop:698 length:234 start_codon:yes stop_codon:yes gene_type:complete
MKAFNKEQTAAARSLTIAYMAFLEIDFQADNNPLSVLMDAERLLETQEAVGTEMMSTAFLVRLIASYQREYEATRGW